jgi:hypothetical protein
MTVMDIAIHGTFRPDANPDASLASYRDILGFEVRDDVGFGVGYEAAGQHIGLAPGGAAQGMTSPVAPRN